jgi:hypothetical protein
MNRRSVIPVRAVRFQPFVHGIDRIRELTTVGAQNAVIGGDLLRVWDEPTLARRGFLSHDRPSMQPVRWESESEPFAYWYPISAVAAEIVSKADSWRRRHRVSVRDWPQGM